MAVPFADITDLLDLSTSDFECIEGDSPTYTGDSEVIRKGDGTFMQEDTRMTQINYTHKYHVRNSAATLPVRGKVTGASSVVYFVDEVAVDKPENGHWSMTVTFHRFSDVASANNSYAQITTAGVAGVTPAVATVRLAQGDTAELTSDKRYEAELGFVDNSESAPADAYTVVAYGFVRVIGTATGDRGLAS